MGPDGAKWVTCDSTLDIFVPDDRTPLPSSNKINWFETKNSGINYLLDLKLLIPVVSKGYRI